MSSIKPIDIVLVIIQAVLFLAFLLWDWALSFEACWIKTAGIFISIVGAIITIIAMLQLNKSLSPFPSPKVGGQLITQGLYKFVRHPIYLGIILIMLGYGVFSNSISRIGITILTYVFFYIKSEYEEKMLILIFPEYLSYMKSTGKIWPIKGKNF